MITLALSLYAHAVLLSQVVLETYTGKVAHDPRREDPNVVSMSVACIHYVISC